MIGSIYHKQVNPYRYEIIEGTVGLTLFFRKLAHSISIFGHPRKSF